MFEMQCANGGSAAVRLVLLAMAAAGLAGCADSRGGPIPYDVAGFGVPDAPTVVPLEQNYRIAPLDTLSVRVFKMAPFHHHFELSGWTETTVMVRFWLLADTIGGLDHRIAQGSRRYCR